MSYSKYFPLENYLNQVSITLTYAELEEILGFTLPLQRIIANNGG